MDFDLIDENCCLFMDLKTACYLIAFYSLVSQVIGVVLALFLCTTNEDVSKMLEMNMEDFWGIALAIAVVIVMAVSIVSFTVVLLIGLHRDDRRLIKIYLIFSCFMLAIFVLFCLASEFVFVMNPTATLHRVLSVAVNAFFLYVVRNYWIKLDSNDQQLCQKT